MEKNEWRELIDQIYHDQIAPKMRPFGKRFHPFEIFERYPHYIHETIKGTRLVRFAEQHCDDGQNLYSVFNPDHVRSTIQDLRNGAEFNRHHLVDTGLIETFDEFLPEIVEGMEVSDLPDADFRALRDAGSRNPVAEVRLSMLRLRKHVQSRGTMLNEYPSFRKAVSRAVEELDRKKEELEPDNSTDSGNGPPRKWFKGIGTIGRGTILSLVDLSLLGGWWPLPLSPDTTIVGAVVSLTTGLGDIMNGIGEMRGE